MASQLGGETLSLRNGVRCIADSSTSVEDVLVAIAEQVGGENINYASRMNKAVGSKNVCRKIGSPPDGPGG